MSASEFLELHLSPDSALEPEHQRECEHYMDDYAAAEVKRVAGPLINELFRLRDIVAQCDACYPEVKLIDIGLAAARAEMEA